MTDEFDASQRAAERDAAHADVARLREALAAARTRIECEDWQGTCSCEVRRTGRCACLDEHNEILARIDAALAGEADA